MPSRALRRKARVVPRARARNLVVRETARGTTFLVPWSEKLPIPPRRRRSPDTLPPYVAVLGREPSATMNDPVRGIWWSWYERSRVA